MDARSVARLFFLLFIAASKERKTCPDLAKRHGWQFMMSHEQGDRTLAISANAHLWGDGRSLEETQNTSESEPFGFGCVLRWRNCGWRGVDSDLLLLDGGERWWCLLFSMRFCAILFLIKTQTRRDETFLSVCLHSHRNIVFTFIDIYQINLPII